MRPGYSIQLARPFTSGRRPQGRARAREVSMTMQPSQWSGVFPAITTPFTADGSVDHAALAAHVTWLADAGCAGIVTGGSLGGAGERVFDGKGGKKETGV